MPFRLKFSYTHVQRHVSTKIRKWREASYSIYLSINDAQQDLRLDRLFYPKQEFNLSSRAIFRYTSLNFTMDKKEKKKYYAADRKRIELNFDRKSDLTREREGKLWNAIFHRLTSGMPIIPLVVCHVDTHRVIPHRFHVVNSHVSILLLVAEHRIFTCDVNATWINGTNRYKRNGHFARRSKKERWVGGRREGEDLSSAHSRLEFLHEKTIYIYGVEEIRWPKSK